MAGKTLDEATKEQALSAAVLNRTRDEVERRRRIPIDIALRGPTKQFKRSQRY